MTHPILGGTLALFALVNVGACIIGSGNGVEGSAKRAASALLATLYGFAAYYFITGN